MTDADNTRKRCSFRRTSIFGSAPIHRLSPVRSLCQFSPELVARFQARHIWSPRRMERMILPDFARPQLFSALPFGFRTLLEYRHTPRAPDRHHLKVRHTSWQLRVPPNIAVERHTPGQGRNRPARNSAPVREPCGIVRRHQKIVVQRIEFSLSLRVRSATADRVSGQR